MTNKQIFFLDDEQGTEKFEMVVYKKFVYQVYQEVKLIDGVSLNTKIFFSTDNKLEIEDMMNALNKVIPFDNFSSKLEFIEERGCLSYVEKNQKHEYWFMVRPVNEMINLATMFG